MLLSVWRASKIQLKRGITLDAVTLYSLVQLEKTLVCNLCKIARDGFVGDTVLAAFRTGGAKELNGSIETAPATANTDA